MDTNELIRTLGAAPRRPMLSLEAAWWCAAALGVASAAAVFFMLLGPRPDIALAAQTPQFLFKFLVSIALAVTAFAVARPLSRPGANWRRFLPYFAAPPALIAAAVVVELSVLPPDLWAARTVGTNSMACLTYVTLIGLGPLAIFLLPLRYGAPSSPARAGAAAGLLAGGIAATFYAARCTDDSPLFVAAWYTMAVAALALLGAACAHRYARW